MIRFLLLALLALAGSAAAGSVAAPSAEGSPRAEAGDQAPTLWYFRHDRCPVCARSDEWLAGFEDERPQLAVRRVDVLRDEGGLSLFREMMREHGESDLAVPAFVLDGHVWIGFSRALAAEIEATAAVLLADGEAVPTRGAERLDLGFLGSVDLAQRSMFAATVLIAFVDGFNPCSLWVLTILLAMIVGTRSRTRVAIIGLAFLTVTAAVYGLFISGLFSAFMVIGHMDWIRAVVVLFALVFGLVNVKDYFAFGRGISFIIPQRFKPGIYHGGRLLRSDRPLPALLALTVLLALGIALIELPCTAGFPVMWASLVAGAGVGGAGFGGLLGLYLLIYLSVEIAILATALVTMRPDRLQERHGRVLKLFGGMVMIALAVALAVEPGLMESLAGSLLVIGGAIAASLLVLSMSGRGEQ